MLDIDSLFADVPKLTRWQSFKRRWRQRLMWPQCTGRHMPHAHMTDEECRHSLMVSIGGNKKRYWCMRRRWHLGQCRDIHGRQFDK